ncbi:MAG TPA: alcohol dehydrogenase catalytic domain-containing protein [Candidatus Bathyarchaeia archaeon]|nr:alcohol dehydrogenase catalytic domain-containing protein [Candidatus Bathyarchaeia archaeon]
MTAPTSIRAAVLDRPGVPTRVETLDLDPPGVGEVRVRMVASGVCHSDLHVRDGEWERAGPIVLGHEGAAVVDELGPGVDAQNPGLHPGMLVVLAWLIPCGICRACRAGKVWLCSASPSYTHRMPSGRAALHRPAGGGDVLTYSAIGTFAERQNVPAAAAIPVDPATPPEIAALIGCCVTTGVGAMTKTADIQPGSSVAVIGLGGVGLSCVIGAALAGASRIVAVDRIQAKLDLARSLGATDTVLAGSDDAATLAAIRDLTDGGPDVCAEAIGLPRTIELAIASLPTGGTALLVGMTPFGIRASFEAFPFVDGGRRIIASNYGSADPVVDFPRYASLNLAGRLPAERLVTSRIGLDGLEDAFAAMRRGEGVRAMIGFSQIATGQGDSA